MRGDRPARRRTRGARGAQCGRALPATFLLLVSGCGGGPERAPAEPPRADMEAAPDSPAEAERVARTLRWSTPVHYHGIDVRLELPPGGATPSARIERLDAGDRIVCGEIALSHRFQRFEVTGGGRYHFEEGSRVFVFRPPSAGTPWESRGADFALAWAGDGTLPVIQEDRRGGVVIWHFGRSRVERASDGSLLHRHGEEERRFRPPVTLLLGPNGELIESRPTIR